jgi:hypothetical protein
MYCMDHTYSIIGSMGRTATHWIAQALNCHRDVFFVHGFDFDPRKDLEEPFHVSEARVASHGGNLADISKRIDFHDRYFDVIESVGSFHVYGSVHSLVPIFNWPGKIEREYRTCCIVRNPIQRIASFLNKNAQLLDRYIDSTEGSALDVFTNNYPEYIEPYGRDDPHALYFLWAVHRIIYYDNMFRQTCPAFKMEDIVSNDEAFEDFFIYTTGLNPDDGFWERKAVFGPINQSDSFGHSPAQILAGWSDWQREVVIGTLASFDGVTDFYEDMGYEIAKLNWPPELFSEDLC